MRIISFYLLIVLVTICLTSCNKTSDTVQYSDFLQLHPENPHYLMYEGKPILIVTSSEHYGAVLNLDFDYKTYLKALNEDGMNMTRAFTGTYVENPESFGILFNTLAPKGTSFICPWARSDVPGYKAGGNKFDLDKWDDGYFNRLKDFVSVAKDNGIMVEVTLFSSIYNDKSWTFCPLDHDNNINQTDTIDRKNVHTPDNGNLMSFQEKVVKKIVQELKDFPNVFYEIQNEPWADNTARNFWLNPNDSSATPGNWRYNVEIASDAALEWQKKVTSWIVDAEQDFENKHLIAQNYCNFYYPVEEVDSNISIMNFHYAWPQAVHMNYGYNRVISFDEDGFKGDDPAPYRKNAWNFMLAGGGIYDNLDYSFFVGAEDGSGINTAPGHGSAVLRSQLAFLKEFLESFDFIHLKPDPSVVKLPPGTFPQVLANHGKEYAIYLDGGTQCDLQLYIPPGKYMATWINPVSFETEKEVEIINNIDQVTLASPEYDGEIALKIAKVNTH